MDSSLRIRWRPLIRSSSDCKSTSQRRDNFKAAVTDNRALLQCLTALDVPRASTFHAEAWRTPRDELVLCEVASRTGGGEIGAEISELFQVKLNSVIAQGATLTTQRISTR